MKTEIIQCFIQFQYLLPNSMLTFLFLRVFTGSQKMVLFPSYQAGKLLSTQVTTIYTPSTTRDPRPAIISGRFAALSFCTRTGCRAPWEAVASSGHWVVSGALCASLPVQRPLLLLLLCWGDDAHVFRWLSYETPPPPNQMRSLPDCAHAV